MTIHRASSVVSVARETVFDLIADVERYPEFLPLWRSARVLSRDGPVYTTEQEVGLGPICERFHTTTILCRPQRIEVTSDDPLFRDFRIRWDFDDLSRTRSLIAIGLRWEVRSRLLQVAIDRLLPMTAENMVAAFRKRAEQRSR